MWFNHPDPSTIFEQLILFSVPTRSSVDVAPLTSFTTSRDKRRKGRAAKLATYIILCISTCLCIHSLHSGPAELTFFSCNMWMLEIHSCLDCFSRQWTGHNVGVPVDDAEIAQALTFGIKCH